MAGARARAPFRRAAGTAIPAGMLTAGHPHLDFSGPCQLAAARTKMSETDKTICLNSLFMDFATEAELELFLKSIVEVGTADLYDRLSAAGLIRHVVSKVWNKDQYRISMVFEYDSREGFEARRSSPRNSVKRGGSRWTSSSSRFSTTGASCSRSSRVEPPARGTLPAVRRQPVRSPCPAPASEAFSWVTASGIPAPKGRLARTCGASS